MSTQGVPEAADAGADAGAHAGGSEAGSRPSRRRALLVLGASLVAAACVVAAGLVVVRQDEASAEDHRYVIPAGTAERIEAGEPIEILPTELVVQAGDTLTVVNHDDEAHVVGIADVEPGET
ncbi:hypothetical protein B7486_52830, partial [cyanobacterium TDX16]